MKKNQYAFHIRIANSGVKVIGGTQTADSMEKAAQRIAKRCHLVHHKEEQRSSEGLLLAFVHNYLYQGEKVNLYIAAHPEYITAES